MGLTINAEAYMLEWPWRMGEYPDSSTVDELIAAGIVKRAPAELESEYMITSAGLAWFADGDLLCAYQQTDGEPGDPEADTLLAEIDKRNLDL